MDVPFPLREDWRLNSTGHVRLYPPGVRFGSFCFSFSEYLIRDIQIPAISSVEITSHVNRINNSQPDFLGFRTGSQQLDGQ